MSSGITHLSATGPDAGKRFCGASREAAAYHAAYIDFNAPWTQDVMWCPLCLKTWEAQGMIDCVPLIRRLPGGGTEFGGYLPLAKTPNPSGART